jgi:hypothetical protein
MDASDFDSADRVVARRKTPASRVTPAAWKYIIEREHERRGGEDEFLLEFLFQRFANYVDGHNVHVGCRVPKGMTTFETGFGMNTLVRLSPMEAVLSGKELKGGTSILREFTEKKFLLFIKPERRLPFHWALWKLNSQLIVGADERFHSTIIHSSVKFLDESGVLAVFEKEHGVALFLLYLSVDVDAQARKLLNRAYNLGKLSQHLLEMEHRLS